MPTREAHEAVQILRKALNHLWQFLCYSPIRTFNIAELDEAEVMAFSSQAMVSDAPQIDRCTRMQLFS